MGSLIRQQYTTLDTDTGKRVRRKSKRWYCQYREPSGRWVRVAAYADKAASLQLLAELERDAARGQQSIGHAQRSHAKRAIAEHLAEYVATLKGRKLTDDYVATCEQRCRDLFSSAGVERLGDVSAYRIEQALAKLLADGSSVGSRNGYLIAAKGFVGWCVQDGRLAKNPLRPVKRLNVEKHRRHERRALTPEEFGKLYAATLSAGPCRGVGATDRAIAYLLAYYTGLRRDELGSLTPESFRLRGDTPTVAVHARDEKPGRGDLLPLRQDVAKMVAAWLRGKPAGELVLAIRGAHTSEMIAADLALAGVPYKTAAGFADFHSLRAAFITNLALSNVPVAVAQRLARHSTPVLTLNVYSKVQPHHAASGIDALPPAPDGAALHKILHKETRIAGGSECQPVTTGGTGKAEKPRVKWQK